MKYEIIESLSFIIHNFAFIISLRIGHEKPGIFRQTTVIPRPSGSGSFIGEHDA
jgi:hypothetical protein